MKKKTTPKKKAAAKKPKPEKKKKNIYEIEDYLNDIKSFEKEEDDPLEDDGSLDTEGGFE